jgi:5'-nucleotidase (lipoprotein e(P4) family)
MKNLIKILSLILIACTLLAFAADIYVHKQKADDNALLGMLYQQRAAEYKALCLQAYRFAHIEAEKAWDKATAEQRKHLAIVTDLDETVLDNSRGEAFNFKSDKAFDIFNWWLHGRPDSIPGSVKFFNWAYQKGFHIYYISNRPDDPAIIDSTRTQMSYLHYPFTSNAKYNQFFLFSHNKQNTKQPRRDYVANHFGDHIVLLLGDNLADLQTAFDRERDVVYLADSVRWKLVDKFGQDWGRKYIVLPNAYYGDWEGGFYRDYQLAHHDSTPPDMDTKYKLREAQLKTYSFEK